MTSISFALVLCIAGAASSQDTQLAALHDTLSKLSRQGATASGQGRSKGLDLTPTKHQLRDWIETQLGALKHPGEEEALAYRINNALKPVSVTNEKDWENGLGSLGEVRISNESGILIVITAVGIICGYDQSAYGYKFINGRWQRIWESEQDNYTPDKYTPQHIAAVYVWQTYTNPDAVGPIFIMTLGHCWWCSSAWHPVYYRVWRVDSPGSKLLIDKTEGAYQGNGEYGVGTVAGEWHDENAPVDVLVEFTEGSIDADVHHREAVRHFLIEGDQIRRVDPVALSPRDFVDEWLTRGWDEAATWSESLNLQQWHRRLHSDLVFGTFGNPTMHCQSPDLWQVSLEPHNTEKDFGPKAEVYFLVRWRPPYHFTMANISDKPWPNCTKEDRSADERRTLFATQERRW